MSRIEFVNYAVRFLVIILALCANGCAELSSECIARTTLDDGSEVTATIQGGLIEDSYIVMNLKKRGLTRRFRVFRPGDTVEMGVCFAILAQIRSAAPQAVGLLVVTCDENMRIVNIGADGQFLQSDPAVSPLRVAISQKYGVPVGNAIEWVKTKSAHDLKALWLGSKCEDSRRLSR